MAEPIELIVGLGNPGPQYEATRHNVGFWFVDDIAREGRVVFRAESKFSAEVAQAQVGGVSFRLLKPMTYMNRSGQAVGAAALFYKIAPERILVVHDELDLPVGTVRLKAGGGHGGHNGLRNTMEHVGSGAFLRLRIGIGHPGDKSQVVNYVLQPPSRDDESLIRGGMAQALNVLPWVVSGDIERAMQNLHSRV